MAVPKVLTTDNEIEKALASALSAATSPAVASARIESEKGEKHLVLILRDGSKHSVPVSRLERLAEVDDLLVSNIEVSEDGLGIHWPGLDWDLYVPALLSGVYGTQKWMSALGKIGGQRRSAAKSKAARENGCKGGRPRRRPLSVVNENSEGQETAEAIRLRVRASSKTRFGGGQPGWILHPIAAYAGLYGLGANTRSQALPRIA